MFKKFAGFLLVANIASVNADIYSNPYLTDPSLATTFAEQLRNFNYSEMDNLINSECNQFQEFTYLSLLNWQAYVKNQKSLNEAVDYSNLLVTQFPNRQAKFFTFPLGIQSFKDVDNLIKSSLLTGKDFDYINNNLKNYCLLNLVPAKNFEIATSPKYFLKNSEIKFLSPQQIMELASKKSDKSSFYNLQQSQKTLNKEYSKSLLANLNLSIEEKVVANTLLREDLEIIFNQDNIRWIDYEYFYTQQLMGFKNFLEHGGKSNYFFSLILASKALAEETNNFKNIDIYNAKSFKAIPETNLENRIKAIVSTLKSK